MSAEPTTNSPSPVPDKAAEKKADPYRPEMPKIPGVETSPGEQPQGFGFPRVGQLAQVGPIAAVALTLAIAVFWWSRSSKPRSNADLEPPATAPAESAAPVLPPSASLASTNTNANVATTDELSQPWSSKKFVFVKPYSQESVKAIVVRLPTGELWAFALQDPYRHCELELVTDLDKLASQYGYQAMHPMVGSPCDGTVYDPLKVGPVGGDTWARGEIVKGSALRPPLSINLKVNDRSIIADRME